MGSAAAANRYPRSGERIAPATLREFLLDPIPEGFRTGQADAGLRLCDLDETAWKRFPAETIVELSKLVVDRVGAHHVRKTLGERPFPQALRGIRLEDVRLENRTRRCLDREGLEGNREPLEEYTIGGILGVRAFGPRCLVDLLVALESALATGSRPAARGAGLSEELTSAARRLAKLPAAKSVTREDPRFGSLMAAVEEESATAWELANRLIARRRDPLDPSGVTQQIQQLHRRIQQMPELTLEEELIEIFGSTPYERNRQILIGYYGWEDGQQHTLTEIGTRFGVTRERIRQICAKLTKKHKHAAEILAPVTDGVLALIEKRLPCPTGQLEAELVEKGLTAVGMSLPSMVDGAKLLDRPLSFRIVKIGTGTAGSARLAVRPEQVDPALAVADLAKKEVYFHGLATVEKIQRLVSEKFAGRVPHELVRQTLQLVDGFAWLDERSGWFRLVPISKHGLPKAVEKILAVAGKVTIARMHAAIGRNRRLWKEPPPEKVLLEFCRQMHGVRVVGKRVISDPPRDWRKILIGVEKKLVSVLKEHGPVMERGAMEDLCVRSGMNRFSFHAFVSWSPVIEQFGHSVYGLLGTDVSKRQVDRLIAARRANRVIHRVLDDHGMTDDGKVWLSYRLSKAASTYAVITIPAALKDVVQGRFDLLTSAGRQIGTLATKDGRAWGLGAFLRQRKARIDDRVVLTLDLDARTAVVVLGEEEAEKELGGGSPQ